MGPRLVSRRPALGQSFSAQRLHGAAALSTEAKLRERADGTVEGFNGAAACEPRANGQHGMDGAANGFMGPRLVSRGGSDPQPARLGDASMGPRLVSRGGKRALVQADADDSFNGAAG